MGELRVPAPKDLPQRVERARVERGTVAVWHLGGAGLILKTPAAIVYVDPYIGDGAAEPALGGRGVPVPFDPGAVGRIDAVLCTHDHVDHTDPETLAVWRRHLVPPVFGPASSTDLAREWGYPEERLRTLPHGETAAVADVRITSVRAYDPLAKGANGYLLEAQGVSLLHMGDSLYFAELGAAVGRPVDALYVSVGHNPTGKNFYMTEVDAARAARDVGARTLVPVHWDLWRSFYLDPRRVGVVARWYCPAVTVRIPRYGRRMVLTAPPATGQ
jgi:L-ascorbate 6-phosphate lactonase